MTGPKRYGKAHECEPKTLSSFVIWLDGTSKLSTAMCNCQCIPRCQKVETPENSEPATKLPEPGEVWHYNSFNSHSFLWPVKYSSNGKRWVYRDLPEGKSDKFMDKCATGLCLDTVDVASADRKIVILLVNEETVGTYQESFLRAWTKVVK